MGEERSLGGEEQEEMPLLPWELHAESWEQSSTCSPVGHSSHPCPLTGFSGLLPHMVPLTSGAFLCILLLLPLMLLPLAHHAFSANWTLWSLPPWTSVAPPPPDQGPCLWPRGSHPSGEHAAVTLSQDAASPIEDKLHAGRTICFAPDCNSSVQHSIGARVILTE